MTALGSFLVAAISSYTTRVRRITVKYDTGQGKNVQNA